MHDDDIVDGIRKEVCGYSKTRSALRVSQAGTQSGRGVSILGDIVAADQRAGEVIRPGRQDCGPVIYRQD